MSIVVLRVFTDCIDEKKLDLEEHKCERDDRQAKCPNNRRPLPPRESFQYKWD